jgi:integrase/recombinase XerC
MQRVPTLALARVHAPLAAQHLSMPKDSSIDAVFLNRYSEPIGERGVRKIVAKYIQQAGIPKRVSPHGLRHTFATQKAGKGVSPYQLQEWLGHARLDTTQIYVHMSKEECGQGHGADELIR